MDLLTATLIPWLLSLGVSSYGALHIIGLKWLPMPLGVAPLALVFWGLMACVVVGPFLVGALYADAGTGRRPVRDRLAARRPRPLALAAISATLSIALLAAAVIIVMLTAPGVPGEPGRALGTGRFDVSLIAVLIIALGAILTGASVGHLFAGSVHHIRRRPVRGPGRRVPAARRSVRLDRRLGDRQLHRGPDCGVAD